MVFLRTNIGLDLDLLLLLPALLLRNLMSGGGNFSVRPGLETGLADSFMSSDQGKVFLPLLLPMVSLPRKCVRERVWFGVVVAVTCYETQSRWGMSGGTCFLQNAFLIFVFFCCGLFYFYCIFARMGESTLLSRSFLLFPASHLLFLLTLIQNSTIVFSFFFILRLMLQLSSPSQS